MRLGAMKEINQVNVFHVRGPDVAVFFGAELKKGKRHDFGRRRFLRWASTVIFDVERGAEGGSGRGPTQAEGRSFF